MARYAAMELLDTIGTPVILLTHSQGGGVGWGVADGRPNLVRAIVTVEPGGPQIANVDTANVRYRDEPEAAVITLRAEGALGEGVTCSVPTARALVEAGLHPATGGSGLHACSGDMLLEALARQGRLDDTLILFLGDNGYFFGEHGLGPERRFAYEEGIRSPFVLRYPRKARAGARSRDLVICQDIAPTLIELAGGRPGAQVQGRSLLPLLAGRRKGWRRSFLVEYWAEQALPWLVGMTYKAVRTDRYKYIHWVNRGRAGELDELYDLEKDPWELKNLNASSAHRRTRATLKTELRRLVSDAVSLKL